MFAQPFTKKTLIIALILVAAIITLAFAAYSVPASPVSADRSYDRVEDMRVGSAGSAPLADTRYEAIQEWRMARADHSYDAIENLRLLRTLK